MSEDDVEDLVEAQEHVDHHGAVVVVGTGTGEDGAQARPRFSRLLTSACTGGGGGVGGLQEGPVHEKVPEARVHGVERGEGDEHGQERVGFVNAVHRQGDVIEDCSSVFSEVGEMGKCGVSVAVTAQTLQGTPDARERGEEA